MIDTERVKKAYRRTARLYDVTTGRLSGRLRASAVARAELSTGEVVLDLGCGTGLTFDLLEQAVGPEGHVIGVEVSPDMLARAREKIERHGWTNVTLIEANAEDVELEPDSVDAVVSMYTNDIMHSRPAVERAVGALRPGGRFVAAGAKQASGLSGLLINPLTLAYSIPFITTSLTAAPWTHMEDLLGPLDVEERLWGSAYIAHGMQRVEQTSEAAKQQVEVKHGS